MDYAFPASLAEALKLQADEKTRGRVVAGGTDLMVQWASGLQPIPDRAVDVFSVPELKRIDETANALVIGAAVTHAEIRAAAAVQKYLPALAAAAATIGGAQIQARGTIAGNVVNASPAGDLAPALMIADGSVVVASVRGEREVRLADFWQGYRMVDLQPDELVVRFILSRLPEGQHEGFHKLGTRAAQAISKVMGAYRGVAREKTIQEFRIALGSVAAVPVRLRELEKWIVGKKIGKKVLDEAERRAADEVKPIDDIRSTAEYRQWVSGRLVRAFLEQMLAA